LDRAKLCEGVGKMTEKKIFIEPELIKYEESLNEMTLAPAGSTEAWLKGDLFDEEVAKMTEKKIFVEPELIKYEESLDDVTLAPFVSTDGSL